MKTHGKKLTALLLALCIVLGLAACGSGGDDKKDGPEQLSGTVYVPTFIDLDLEADYINSACCDGTNVYIVADASSEEITESETGETITTHSYRTTIFRVSLEDGSVTELENYEPAYSFENSDDGWFNIDSISAGADGTLWVSERAYIYEFDLPEDFDEETGNKWDFQTSRNVELRRQLDSTGKELNSIDTSTMQEKLGEVDYINSTAMDAEGCFYISGGGPNGSKIAVLDKDMNVLFTVDDDSWGDLTLLGDGTMAVRRRDPEGNLALTVLDKAAKGWAADSYPLPYSANNIYNGSEKYLFYYNSGESLYGYNAETQEGERLLSWSAADINMDRLGFFTFLADGRVAAMSQDWVRTNQGDDYSTKQVTELAILEEKDASVLADKTVLTFATMGLGSDMRASIIKFNKTSDKYRIEIRDYSEYSTKDDYQAGLTRLNTEILAGNVPDILAVSGLPMRQYGARGVLEDLWPHIENDPDIGRDSLMDRVFTAAEQDGKLYQAFDSFSISTVIGSRDVVGDGLGWTLEEMKAALAKMPDGCAIFGESDTKSGMLQYILALNVDAYINWNSGECSFDSDAFKAALEFCNSFPAEYDWESRGEDYEDEPTRIAAGKQMLITMGLDGFGDFQVYEAMFAGAEGLQTYERNYSSGSGETFTMVGSSSSSDGVIDMGNVSQRLIPGRYVTFKGFPMEDGSCGSSFTIRNSLAMSSTCKDKEGAWSFIREMLLPKEDRRFYDSYGWAFPSNKEDFDAAAADAMEVEYVTDYEGNQVLDQNGNPVQESKGGWSWDNLNIDLVATSQEEYDQIMELYNTIDTVSEYDTNVYDIVNEMAGSYFSGDKSLDETASLIQGKVQLYINENR